MEKLKEWWRKYKYEQALNDIERLEVNRKFIDRFFLGETMVELRLKEWEKQMEDVRARLEKYKI